MDDHTLLRLIDAEIARLQESRIEVISRLGGASNGAAKHRGSARVTHVGRKGKTREEQLLEFLKLNGPSAPKAILTGTGMPRGSFSFTLTRISDRVERLEDGRIALKR
jgi:hypothetical protein